MYRRISVLDNSGFSLTIFSPLLGGPLVGCHGATLQRFGLIQVAVQPRSAPLVHVRASGKFGTRAKCKFVPACQNGVASNVCDEKKN